MTDSYALPLRHDRGDVTAGAMVDTLMRLRERAEAQARVAAVLNAGVSLDAILALAARELRAAMHGQRVSIALADAGDTTQPPIRLAYAAVDEVERPEDGDSNRNANVPFTNDAVALETLAAGQPRFQLMTEDVSVYKLYGIRAGLLLPLRNDDAMLGLALVGWTAIRPAPHDDEISFAQTLANICAAAITRGRTADEHARTQRFAGALNTAMTHALAADNEDAALSAIGDTLEEIGFHLTIRLWDETERLLSLRYSSFRPRLRVALQDIAGHWPFDVAEVATDRTISAVSKASFHNLFDALELRIPRLAERDRGPMLALLNHPQVIIAPLRTSGKLLGACTVLGPLRPADVPMAQAWADAIAGILVQRRLLAATAEMARRQAALAALTADLASASEPNAVLERAVDAAAELLGAYTVAAFITRDDGQGFDVAASRGLAPLQPNTPVLQWEATIAGRAVRSRAMQVVKDAAVERAGGTSFPMLAGGMAVGALLVAPIAEGDSEPAGALEVYATTRRAWPPEDCALLRALASACAVALRNARDITRIQREAARSGTLAELSAALHGAEDPDTVLHLLVRGACNALGASRAQLSRRNGPGSPLRIIHEYAAEGIRPVSEFTEISSPPLWPATMMTVDEAAPIVIDDLAGHPAYAAVAAGPHDGGQRARAIIIVPVVESQDLIGLLGVQQCGRPRHWEAAEVEFLQTLAGQAATAVRQRRLLLATREHAQRLTALNRVAESVIGAPSFGAMCDRTITVTTDVLGASAAAIHVFDETAPPARALRLVSWLGIPAEAINAWAAMAVGEGLTGLAASRRQPVFIAYMDETPPEAAGTLTLVRQLDHEARAAVPLLARGRLLGVLVIAFQAAHTWTDSDCILLQTVANQLAGALEAEHLRAAAAAAHADREADRLKSELLATVSHELRTPLGAIKGFASGLIYYRDRLSPADIAESLQLIDAAADRLTELIDNLLDLQRLEAGKLPVARDRVDLSALTARILAELAPHAPRHQLRLDAPARWPLFVRGDARRLRQILENLLGNALKYSPQGGPISVTLTGRAQQVELRVADAGIGIPPAHLAHIFERFHRVDNSTTRRIGGTGLGLAIVQGLVLVHGGAIRAESRGDGQGSTFIVTLPRTKGTRL